MVLIFNQLKSYLAYIVMRPCFLIEGGHYLIQQESHPSIYKVNTFFSLFFCFFTFCGRRGGSDLYRMFGFTTGEDTVFYGCVIIKEDIAFLG